MAKLIYGLAGEGRGHAIRARALADELKSQHQLILLAPRGAYELLDASYRHDPQVSVRRLPGLYFAYRGQRVAYGRTFAKSLIYWQRLPSIVRYLGNLIERERVDLAISDFDPALPRAARRVGLPFISLDHQHYLWVSDFRQLPWGLRMKAAGSRLSVPVVCRGQAQTIVSSFRHFPLRRGMQRTSRVGVLLRKSIREAQASDLGHVLVYLRRHAPSQVLSALQRCGRPVHVFGLGLRPQDANLSFHPIAEADFTDLLKSCHALVTNAGNQLVGEALYLRKPVLAMPEEGNFEQQLNAYLVQQTPGADCVWTPRAFARQFPLFLEQNADLREQIDPESVQGNDQVVPLIESLLPTTQKTTSESHVAFSTKP